MLALYEQSDDFLRQALIYLEIAVDAENPFDPAPKNAFLAKVEDRFS
uniref:Epsilon-coat protein n=1 Tax=Panagrellus redivivus TaxID=6233 RepID=A0A7E4UV12_PANRE